MAPFVGNYKGVKGEQAEIIYVVEPSEHMKRPWQNNIDR